MGQIGTPVVDNNTVALIKFDQNGLVDLCKKVSWTRSGTPKIIDDATMGKIMVGNGCSYTSSSVSFGTNTTMEAWVWIQSNSGRAGYCHMQCDDDAGTNIGTNKNVFHFVIWGADSDVTTTDGWHHVAITLSGKTSSRFVDGKLVETKTSSHNPVGSGILDVAKDCDGVLNDNVSKIAFVRFSSCIRYTTNFDPKAIWKPEATRKMIDHSVSIDTQTQINSYAHVASVVDSKHIKIENTSEGAYDKFQAGTEIVFHAVGCLTSETKQMGIYGFSRIVAAKDNTLELDRDIPSVDITKYTCQVVTVPCFAKGIKINCQLWAKEYDVKTKNGGIIIVKSSDVVDLRSGSLLTEGKGLPRNSCLNTRTEADKLKPDGISFSNAGLHDRWIMSQGNGIVVVIANKTLFSTNTRLGATWSGASGPGKAKTGIGNPGNDASGKAGGQGGTTRDHGSWDKNRSYSYARTRAQGGYSGHMLFEADGGGGYGGACVVLVSKNISGLTIASISTGGQGGDNWNYGDGGRSSAGGAGYGGGGGCGDKGGDSTQGGGGGGFCLIATESSIAKNDFAYELKPFYASLINFGELVLVKDRRKKEISINVRNTSDDVKNISLLSRNEREEGYNDHKLNVLVERPDVYAYFPCEKDAKDACGNEWKAYGNVKFMTDSVKKPGDIGYGFIRFDSSNSSAAENSWLYGGKDIGTNICVDCWFRFQDNKNTNYVVGFKSFNCWVQYDGTNKRYLAHVNTNGIKCTKADSSVAIQPNTWHHLFFYHVGNRGMAAIDGKWMFDEVTDIEVATSNETWQDFGGWNYQPGKNDPRAFKQIIDICNIRIMKTVTPFWPFVTDEGFRPPMHPYPYILKDNKIYEYRFVPLMQDLTNRNLGVRIGEEVFADDPFVDVDNLEPKSKLMHVKNVNGVPTDITGKTTWAATNVFPADDYYGAAMDFHHGDKWGALTKSGGSDIIVGTGDFTVLIDFKIKGKNAAKDSSGNLYTDWNNDHYLMSGSGALQLSFGNAMTGFAVSDAGWVSKRSTGTSYTFEFNKDYRIIFQRKNSILNVWINGKRVVYNRIDDWNYIGPISKLGSQDAAERTNSNSEIRNVVIWNKAIIPADSSIEKINGIYCTKKTWRLEAKDALLDGDIEKGATQWQFVLK